jgi:rhodanese-related sulfurtransferase
MTHTTEKCLAVALATLCALPVLADNLPGNRYNLSPRLYDSEVSAAKAYLLTNHDRGNKSKDEYANAIILDVRRISEHVAGHPPGAYSIPFPHIWGSPKCANDNGVDPCLGETEGSGYIGYDVSEDATIGFGDENMNDGVIPIIEFVEYVESVIRDKDTPILTLCATGYRSVQAANALVTYGGYNKVRNIWEGFNGQPKYAYAGNQIAVDENGDPVALDLNNDGVVDGNDRDGWNFYQELPVSTKIHPKRIDRDFADLYYQ